jgi:glutamate formiminotransferase / formiminotetrahydrofolate cyclodeaminase
LVDAAIWYTQLDQFNPDQILESRIYQNDQSTDLHPAGASFLDEVAAATAAPGGGSAAAYAGALGAALVSMVAGLTLGKKKYIEVEAEMQAVHVQAEELRKELTDAVEDDSAAFEAVMGALKLPKGTEEEQQARQAAIIIATLNAAHVPLITVAHSVKVMELAALCARDGNLNAISDAMSASALARAALTAAGYNVRINLNSLEDKVTGETMLQELRDLEKKADKIEKEIQKTMENRGGVA